MTSTSAVGRRVEPLGAFVRKTVRLILDEYNMAVLGMHLEAAVIGMAFRFW